MEVVSRAAASVAGLVGSWTGSSEGGLFLSLLVALVVLALSTGALPLARVHAQLVRVASHLRGEGTALTTRGDASYQGLTAFLVNRELLSRGMEPLAAAIAAGEFFSTEAALTAYFDETSDFDITNDLKDLGLNKFKAREFIHGYRATLRVRRDRCCGCGLVCSSRVYCASDARYLGALGEGQTTEHRRARAERAPCLVM